MKKKLLDFIYGQNLGDNPDSDDSLEEIINFTIYTESSDKYVEDFKTPLISALIRKKQFELALELAKTQGLDLMAVDSVGKTPLDYAQEKSHDPLIIALSGRVEADLNSFNYLAEQ